MNRLIDSDPSAPCPRPPRLIGRRTELQAVSRGDLPFLYELETNSAILHRWRHASTAIPSQEDFAASYRDGVLAQFIVRRVATGERLGHVRAFGARLSHGTASVAVVIRPELAGRGWALEGGGLFVDYLFKTFPLRKIYAETIEYNLTSSFSSGLDKFFQEEGRLKEHSYYDGRFWDLIILALYRDDWVNLSSPFFARIDRFQAAHSKGRKAAVSNGSS